jgi:hypothetical protein
MIEGMKTVKTGWDYATERFSVYCNMDTHKHVAFHAYMTILRYIVTSKDQIVAVIGNRI